MKNISFRSNTLLQHFLSVDKLCFSYDEAYKVLNDSSDSAVKELLRDIIRRGLLMRVKKGIYYIIPFEQDADKFMPDWHLLVSCLVSDVKYYIGYYSALQIHGLITQPSLHKMVVVNKQIRPSTMVVKNTTYQFIYHNEKHFFGVKKTWIDSYHKVLCSDLEKTLIDCLFKPEYSGGIVEIAKAIHAAQNKIDFNKLLKYCIQFDSQAVIKRLGFILDVLDISNPIHKDLQKIKTATFALLDTELPKTGKRSGIWSIQENLDLETIKSAIYT
jgi:predicted transcriptional regulator of viral defense system